MVISVPRKLLKALEKERGLSFYVSVTMHYTGEVPGKTLIDGSKLKPETLQLLLDRGAKVAPSYQQI